MASIERTAYPRFKRFMSARELHVFYTPQPDEIVWAREAAGGGQRRERLFDCLIILLRGHERHLLTLGVSVAYHLMAALDHLRDVIGPSLAADAGCADRRDAAALSMTSSSR
jgi:hypothetical protein